MTKDTVIACARLRDWFVQDALPLWSANGYDHHHGGFYEALGFSGTPIRNRARRVRVQARQIYTFTQSTQLGWCAGDALAAKAFDYLFDKACPDGGNRGCVHLLSEEGEVLDNRRDLYDQAFLLLACAARIQAGDDRARHLADKTISFLDKELKNTAGGWSENDSAALPRRQNPHMHLFEAFMALYEATKDQQYLINADDLYALFVEKFFDTKRGVLLEFFDSDLSPAEDQQTIEPGHMMEWVWLLDRYQKLGRPVDETIPKKLFLRAFELGTDFQKLLVGHVALSGPDAGKGRRVWPQTEFLKASLIIAQTDARNDQLDIAGLVDKIFETYFDLPVAGLWCDQHDGNGAPVAKDVPASILYHWFEAAKQATSYINDEENL